MALEDDEGRQARIEKAWLGIERLETKLRGKRCRLRLRDKVEKAATKILKDAGADRWVRVEIAERMEPVFRQEKRGHPGPKTKYLRNERLRFSVAARVKDDVIVADARTDGMFPLISNCRDLSLKQILEAYKFQPKLEKVESLPLYPDERECRAPSTERILDLFAPLQRHRLRRCGTLVQVSEPDLGKLHKKVLALMQVSASAFRLRP